MLCRVLQKALGYLCKVACSALVVLVQSFKHSVWVFTYLRPVTILLRENHHRTSRSIAFFTRKSVFCELVCVDLSESVALYKRTSSSVKDN
jgi:hypothetical protein